MPRTDIPSLNLNVDLQRGVVPISKAASSLAALIKRAKENGQPVIVTQKGYPTGVLLPIELFTALKDLASDQGMPAATPEPKTIDEIKETLEERSAPSDEADVAPEESTTPPGRQATGRRRKRTDDEPVEAGA